MKLKFDHVALRYADVDHIALWSDDSKKIMPKVKKIT